MLNPLAVSANTRRRLSAQRCKAKASVQISWDWALIWLQLSGYIARLHQRERDDWKLGDIDPTIVERAVAHLFDSTCDIENVRLAGYEFKLNGSRKRLGAYLADLDPADDTLGFLVQIHPHVAVYLRLKLSPCSVLARSRGALAEASSGAFLQEAFGLTDDEATTVELRATSNKSRGRRVERTEALKRYLTQLPADTRDEYLVCLAINLFATYRYREVGRKVSVSKHQMGVALRSVLPERFVDERAVLAAIQTACAQQLIKDDPSVGKGHMSYTILNLLPAGDALVASLKPPS